MSAGWENENRYRTYPFEENQDMRVGSTALPNDFIVDCQAFAYSGAPGGLRLTEIERGLSDIVLLFSFIDAPGTFSVAVPGGFKAPPDSPLMLTATNEYADTLSIWVYDATQLFEALGQGTYSTSIQIEPTLVVDLSDKAVNSMKGDTDTSIWVYSDIIVENGYNVAVRQNRASSSLNFVAGAGLGKGPITIKLDPNRLDCTGVIRHINGVTPSLAGDIPLQFGPGFEATYNEDASEIVVRTSPVQHDLHCRANN